jgi:divalent metal cation (Fe/Co/Zn/Cd) transporter
MMVKIMSTVKNDIFYRFMLPFMQWYLTMIGVTVVIDYILHRLGLVHLGIYLGYIGTALVISSFLYSLRKRKLIRSGSPKQLLQWHEYGAWIGAIFILIHAGIHFNAVLPWLAILMLLLTVASGLVGKYLLKKATESFKIKKQELLDAGKTPAEIDQILLFDAVTVEAMKKWRVVHMPITYFLAIFSLIHIITAIMYGT